MHPKCQKRTFFVILTFLFQSFSERRSSFLSAGWAPLTFWKMSAELSAAHNFTCERELSADTFFMSKFERELSAAHFLMN